jgi:hypothetical protein
MPTKSRILDAVGRNRCAALGGEKHEPHSHKHERDQKLAGAQKGASG